MQVCTDLRALLLGQHQSKPQPCCSASRSKTYVGLSPESLSTQPQLSHAAGRLQDMFGHVRTDSHQRGLYYLFYTYNSISGGAVLAALVAGDAAVAFEQKAEQECVSEVMQLLRGIFGPQGVTVPDPVQVKV